VHDKLKGNFQKMLTRGTLSHFNPLFQNDDLSVPLMAVVCHSLAAVRREDYAIAAALQHSPEVFEGRPSPEGTDGALRWR
jgi:hypothetical protein